MPTPIGLIKYIIKAGVDFSCTALHRRYAAVIWGWLHSHSFYTSATVNISRLSVPCLPPASQQEVRANHKQSMTSTQHAAVCNLRLPINSFTAYVATATGSCGPLNQPLNISFLLKCQSSYKLLHCFAYLLSRASEYSSSFQSLELFSMICVNFLNQKNKLYY